jgi:hypothetical protein
MLQELQWQADAAGELDRRLHQVDGIPRTLRLARQAIDSHASQG